MQLRNEWNKTPPLFKCFNFVFSCLASIVRIWLVCCAVLGLRPWRAQKALLGILRRVLGASAKFAIHPTWLISRLSHWLLRPQLDFPNSPGTDSYPFVSYHSGEAPSEGFATLRNVPKLLTRVWAIFSARAQVSRGKGDVNTWQMLLGVWVPLELTEPLRWWRNNISQANSSVKGYREK